MQDLTQLTIPFSRFFWTNVTHFHPNTEVIFLCSWPDRPGLSSPPDGLCLQQPRGFFPPPFITFPVFKSLSKWCGTMFHCCFLTQGLSSDVAMEHLSVISSSWECTSHALSFVSTRGLSGSVLPSAAASSWHPEDHPGQRHLCGHRHFPALPGETQTGGEWNDVCHGQQQHLLDGGHVL